MPVGDAMVCLPAKVGLIAHLSTPLLPMCRVAHTTIVSPLAAIHSAPPTLVPSPKRATRDAAWQRMRDVCMCIVCLRACVRACLYFWVPCI